MDGKLTEDPYELSSNNNFVSKADYCRYGKIEMYSDKVKYFLKSFKAGRPGETVPDPWSAFFKIEDLSVIPTARGSRTCEYLEVSKYYFELYNEYLETRNPIQFKFVERAILNGERMKEYAATS